MTERAASESILEQIVAAIGLDGALALAQKHGGKRYRIPAKPSLFLLEALTPDQAETLCKLFRDSPISIPKADAWKRDQRNRAIIADYDGGMTVHQLVERYELSEKQIRQILNRPAPPAHQYLAPAYGGTAHRLDRFTPDLFNPPEQTAP